MEYNKTTLKKLQIAYLVAKAAQETAEKLDKEIKTQVLAENEYLISNDWEERSGQRILNPNSDYLMTDNNFDSYCKKVFELYKEHGIVLESWDRSATWPSRKTAIEAEKALIKYGCEITPKNLGLTYEMVWNGKEEHRKQYLDLICRLA